MNLTQTKDTPVTLKSTSADVVTAGDTDQSGAALKPPRANARRDAALEMARAGVLPPVPDFSAPTHRSYRRHLANLVALVEAQDAGALQAYPINPVSSSRRILARYRDAAVVALGAILARDTHAAAPSPSSDRTLSQTEMNGGPILRAQAD